VGGHPKPSAVVWQCVAIAVYVSCVETVSERARSSSPCGPPHYCARTDQKVEPYPAAPPTLGPAGTTINDPSFGERILRVTDAGTDSKHPGEAYHTPGNSEQNAWNKTSTRFFDGDANGNTFLFSFDVKTMRAHPEGRLVSAWRGDPEFSFVSSDILYGMTARNPAFQQYDLVSRKFTTINEASSCVNLGSSEAAFSLFVSADDVRMSMVIGPEQDRNYLIYVYDRKKGCRWYNTQTGTIGGQWGPTGTISSGYRYSIHNAEMSKSGDSLDISTEQFRGLFFWDVATLNVTFCAQNPIDHCSGHSSLGYSHMLNSANSHHPLELIKRPLGDLHSMSYLFKEMPSLQGWYDYHTSWNYIDPTDDTPVCFSTYRPNNPAGAPPIVLGPWENEIDCVETDGRSPTVWRFAHTFSTAQNGFWSTPRGNVSQDGRFYMFTSDWEDQLGPDPSGKRHRTDVFIVELR
jgi:hypothetical protein